MHINLIYWFKFLQYSFKFFKGHNAVRLTVIILEIKYLKLPLRKVSWSHFGFVRINFLLLLATIAKQFLTSQKMVFITKMKSSDNFVYKYPCRSNPFSFYIFFLFLNLIALLVWFAFYLIFSVFFYLHCLPFVLFFICIVFRLFSFSFELFSIGFVFRLFQLTFFFTCFVLSFVLFLF